MITQGENNRYERKFVIEGKSNQELENIIKRHPAAFSSIFNSRYINNIYLDTPSLTFYYDNNVGKSYRKKARIRWYGDLFGTIEKPMLEFKLKTGAVGDKISFQLNSFVFDNNFNINYLHRIIRESNLPDWAVQELLPLQPALVNRYLRQYFLSFNKLFRVTIDDELTYCNIKNYFNTFSEKTTDSNSRIIELKYSWKHDKEANEISTKFPFRITKSSKYVNGIEKFRQHIAI